MSGDVQVRFCESLRVRFLRATRLLILCKTNRQLERCKQRMMKVLRERRLSLSSKKTRMGSIDKGFHFLGINYPGTQTQDNTNVTQANDRSVIQLNTAHYLTSLGGGRQMSQLTIKNLRWIVSSRTQGRCGKYARMLKQWSNLRSLLAGSEATCIAGARGG